MKVSDAYWAGFFDGEGCVIPEKFFSKTHQKKFIVGVKVCVTQKEPFVLLLLQKQFGGFVLKNRDGIHKWYLGKAKPVAEFLRLLKPHLVIKAVEANIALQLLEGISKKRDTEFIVDELGRKMIKRKSPINLEEINRRIVLEQKFKADRLDPKLS